MRTPANEVAGSCRTKVGVLPFLDGGSELSSLTPGDDRLSGFAHSGCTCSEVLPGNNTVFVLMCN